MKMKAAPARLYCLLAREARSGVIFRRGPTRHVLLIKWNLDGDTFEFGQWLKGRIYERRCDLSPSGDKLIYFAATYKEPLMSWTALSKPPWLTAIALWPKGDGWNGGGFFNTDTDLVLNHPQDQSELQPDSDLGDVRVTGHAPYRGEDDTVYHHLLRRGGWVFTQEAVWKKHENKQPNAIGELIEMLNKSDDPLAAVLEEHGMTLDQLEKTKQSLDSFFRRGLDMECRRLDRRQAGGVGEAIRPICPAPRTPRYRTAKSKLVRPSISGQGFGRRTSPGSRDVGLG